MVLSIQGSWQLYLFVFLTFYLHLSTYLYIHKIYLSSYLATYLISNRISNVCNLIVMVLRRCLVIVHLLSKSQLHTITMCLSFSIDKSLKVNHLRRHYAKDCDEYALLCRWEHKHFEKLLWWHTTSIEKDSHDTLVLQNPIEHYIVWMEHI